MLAMPQNQVIDISGSFNTSGTGSGSVLLTDATGTRAPNQWNGVILESGSSASMSFTTIEDAGSNVALRWHC